MKTGALNANPATDDQFSAIDQLPSDVLLLVLSSTRYAEEECEFSDEDAALGVDAILIPFAKIVLVCQRWYCVIKNEYTPKRRREITVLLNASHERARVKSARMLRMFRLHSSLPSFLGSGVNAHSILAWHQGPSKWATVLLGSTHARATLRNLILKSKHDRTGDGRTRLYHLQRCAETVVSLLIQHTLESTAVLGEKRNALKLLLWAADRSRFGDYCGTPYKAVLTDTTVTFIVERIRSHASLLRWFRGADFDLSKLHPQTIALIHKPHPQLDGKQPKKRVLPLSFGVPKS